MADTILSVPRQTLNLSNALSALFHRRRYAGKCGHGIETDVWYEGRFLNVVQGRWTPNSCARACDANVECVAWTLQLTGDRQCHLLGSRTQRHQQPGHIHGACGKVKLDVARLKHAQNMAMNHRIGVVTTIKQVPAAQLAWWLQYHMRIGVSFFILYCEDAAERSRLQRALRAWRCPAVVWRHAVSTSFSESFPKRQDANVNDAIAGCMAVHCDAAVARHCALHRRPSPPVDAAAASDEPNPCERPPPRRAACPVDWLFHFDVDELLHPRDNYTLNRAVAESPGRLLKLPVAEVAKSHPHYLASSSYNFFVHERYFRSSGNLGYGNGKGAGRITCVAPNVRGWVHEFSADGEHAHVPRLELLHYPFCHYEAWRRRYNILSAQHSTDWGFYARSRKAILHDADGGRAFFLANAVANASDPKERLRRIDVVQTATAAEVVVSGTGKQDGGRAHPLSSCSATIAKVASGDFILQR